MANKKGSKKSASRMKPTAAAKKDAVAQEAAEKKDQKKGRKRDVKKIATTVVIVFFAILMVVSMLLPSFAQVFSSNSQARQAEEQTEAPSYGSDEEVSSSTSMTSVDGVFNAYADEISSLEDKLSGDPDNLAYILNLGQAYMGAAYQASNYASTEQDATRISEAFDTAIGYFDQYLALQDSAAVKVDRALCQLYKGDTAGAVSALEQVTTESPDYGPAWANLGLAYEVTGDTSKAKAAYKQAEEADPDDTYGSYTFAEQRLSQLAQSDAQAAQEAVGESTSTSDDSSATGVSGLSQALSGSGN